MGETLFTHLHNHTEYSLLDGLSNIQAMVEQAKAFGMKSLAITDHGGLYGAIEFYTACTNADINPIIGIETYVALTDRNTKTNTEKSPYHLVLLAKNLQGYQNLLKLSSIAHLEGFYYKPRVDKETLSLYSAGLIALSGCPSAEIPKLIQQGLLEEAKTAALWYRNTFDSFYLEIQRHDNLPALTNINDHLINISKETGIPIVATNDTHYVKKEDAPYQDILICIHTNTNINDDKRLQMSDDSYFIKSHDEMASLFSDMPEAISNTEEIAKQCNIKLDFGMLRLPEYTPPGDITSREYLKQLCETGLLQKYGNPSDELKARLLYELKVIETTQFENYMLVVWDIARFTRENNILFGVRGSAAASIVLYTLGITDIDPVHHKLVFERFLNIERHEMPDIDMDFQDDRREEVIEYVRQTYGSDHVAQIITFGTLGPKAAIRDTGRALGMPYGEVDKIARLIPTGTNKIQDAIQDIPDFKYVYENDETTKRLVSTAQHLEGVVRHTSTHAAGVVITKEPLVNYLPLQRPIRHDAPGHMAMTQFPMEPIAKLGLLKMDFLGLTNLTILSQTKDLVLNRRGIEVNLNKIPLDDEKTFSLLSSGETTGVFQLEGSGMRRYIQQLKPTSVSDVSAMIALYRPGPMEHISTFIDAKHGLVPIRYPHPTLETILKETYGVIVYQDQVLLIAQAFAGYSLGEADVVRKAMGKKIPEIMRDEKDKFVNGALKQGFSKDIAEEVFQLIEPFAGYAFNKAHSISYAMIAYWTAYFKANFPQEYMTSVMNAHTGQSDKISTDVTECLRLGIQVLLPDINRSEVNFSIDLDTNGNNAIRYGLSSVKNVGLASVQPLIEERKLNGSFKSLEDMCRRANLGSINRKSLESLIKGGSLDSFGNRGSLVNSSDIILSLAQRESKLRDSGQTTMFDMFGESVSTPIETLALNQITVSKQEQLTWEKEMLGTFVSENPLSILAKKKPTNVVISRGDIHPEQTGKEIAIIGQVSSCRTGLTRENKTFSAVTLELLEGNIEVMVWPHAYEATTGLWHEGSLVEIFGKVRKRNDILSISCDTARHYQIDDDIPSEESASTHPLTNGSIKTILSEQPNSVIDSTTTTNLWIKLEETMNPGHDEHLIREVIKTLMNYPGKERVGLKIRSNGKTINGELPFVNVSYCINLHNDLADIVGYNSIINGKSS